MKTNEIHIRDPFVFTEDGKYYLYGSNGFAGFLVYVSKDLENWDEPVTIFEGNKDFWAEKDYWAPEMHKYKGKYYLFASFKSENRCRGTQILVSDRPDGKFKPISEYPVTPPDWECLDGTLYIDKKGRPYMVFCHEWIQINDGEICAIPLTDDLSAVAGEPRVLFTASQCPQTVSICEGEEKYVTDGPFFFRNGDNLYLLWSSFGKKGYFEAVAKSDNGELDGSWVFDEKLLYDADGGHGMIFKDLDGTLKFVLHCPNGGGNEHPVFFDVCEENGQLII